MTRLHLILALLAVVLIAIAATLPPAILEYLSLNVVGEPPINGKSWLEGVESLGGFLSMRLLATWGILLMIGVASVFLKRKNAETKPRMVENKEQILFFSVTGIFFVVNFAIGYSWWDPNGFLGIGPLFAPSIGSLIVLGIIPELVRKRLNLDQDAFFNDRRSFKQYVPFLAIAAFGYGLVSTIWHCCSFYNFNIVFFYVVTKAVQLWGMCSFFFKWGFKMFLQSLKNEKIAYLATSFLFGFCYPWHTAGFAITFTIFGFLLCVITRKTGSYHAGFLLLYLAYIFHAGLAWQGSEVTLFAIQPISLAILGLFALYLFKKKGSTQNAVNYPPS